MLESLGVTVKLPMIMYVDNTGAIDLAKNWSTTGRTKHIVVRFHFIRELVENGVIEIKFVKSEDNAADILTKNVSEQFFLKHQFGLGVQRSKGGC